VDNRQRPSSPSPSSPPAQAPGGAPAAQVGGGLDVATVRRSWPDVVEAVKRKSRVAWMAIMSGVQPVSLEGNLLTLSFEAEGARTNFTNGGRDAVLREVFREFLGVDWRIDTVLAGAAPAARATAAPVSPPQFASAPPAAPAAASPAPRPTPTARPSQEPAPPPPDEVPPPPPEPIDESDEVDPEGDADADGTEAEISGMALIQRELGGQIIREIDNS
jgi:DNA polymerase III subunit gamma/tau